jgi:hypothetical protein
MYPPPPVTHTRADDGGGAILYLYLRAGLAPLLRRRPGLLRSSSVAPCLRLYISATTFACRLANHRLVLRPSANTSGPSSVTQYVRQIRLVKLHGANRHEKIVASKQRLSRAYGVRAELTAGGRLQRGKETTTRLTGMYIGLDRWCT